MKRIVFAALAAVALVCPRAAFAQYDYSGTITATTCTGTGGGNSAQEAGCIVLNLSPAVASVSVQITGAYVATLQFEATNDSATWVSANAYPLPSGAAVTSTANGTGIWQVDTAGARRFRVRASAFTSAPTVTLAASLDPAAGAGGVAQVQGTTANDTTAAGNSLETAPAVAVTVPTAVTAGRAEKLQMLTANGGVPVGIVDTNTVRQASVFANDTSSALNALTVLPGIAKAGPASITAARSEALQLDTASGGAYVTQSPTTNSSGFSNVSISATASVSVKASAGNLYGFIANNGQATACFLQCVNSSGAGTLGTAPIISFPLPLSTSASAFLISEIPLANFSTGIACGFSTAAGGASACGTASPATIIYK